jgi:hypothetical protein
MLRRVFRFALSFISDNQIIQAGNSSRQFGPVWHEPLAAFREAGKEYFSVIPRFVELDGKLACL